MQFTIIISILSLLLSIVNSFVLFSGSRATGDNSLLRLGGSSTTSDTTMPTGENSQSTLSGILETPRGAICKDAEDCQKQNELTDIYASGDPTKCGTDIQCQDYVRFKKAIETKDATICATIQDSGSKKGCIQLTTK